MNYLSVIRRVFSVLLKNQLYVHICARNNIILIYPTPNLPRKFLFNFNVIFPLSYFFYRIKLLYDAVSTLIGVVYDIVFYY